MGGLNRVKETIRIISFPYSALPTTGTNHCVLFNFSDMPKMLRPFEFKSTY